MIIAFGTERLRDICEESSMAEKELGLVDAQLLQDRLADLRAVSTIEELLVGNPVVAGESREQLSISVSDSITTLWAANHPTPIVDDAGRIDWKRTRRIRLIGIMGIDV